MSYTRVNWKDRNQSPDTPLNARNLNIMDKGIEDLDQKTSNATVEKVGLVKPDGITTKISADGTITAVNGGGGGASVATQVSYSDGVTQLGADNVQTAIEKVLEKNTDYLIGNNMFDKSKALIGKRIDGNANIIDDANYFFSDFIEVEPNSFYYKNSRDETAYYRYALYNENKESVFKDITRLIRTTMDTKYIRFVGLLDDIDITQLEKGSLPTSYKPYRESNVELTAKLSQYENDGFVSRNIYPLNISDMKTQNTTGTWSGNSYTDGNVTFTVNDDGTIKVNGTASKNTTLYLGGVMNPTEYVGKKVVGCPKGGSTLSYVLRMQNYNSPWDNLCNDVGDGYIIINPNNTTKCYFYIVVYSGTTANNLVFKPMITSDLTATHDDYQKGAKSNVELTEELSNKIIKKEIQFYGQGYALYTTENLNGYEIIAIKNKMVANTGNYYRVYNLDSNGISASSGNFKAECTLIKS